MASASITLGFSILALSLASIAPTYANEHGMQQGKSTKNINADDKKLIRNAMKAAPEKVAAGATIIAPGADGKMRTIREGNNGFTCMPDNPSTPGNDPMCMDKAGLEFVTAWMERKNPPTGKIGLMYMLTGGTDASNTDPYATKPESGNNWIKTGPHLMIVGADKSFYDMYPKDPNPDTSQPYVMWPNTPYQHLMIPVK